MLDLKINSIRCKLEELKTESRHRVEVFREYETSFSSNNYLNFTTKKIIKKSMIEALREFGTGADSSKFVGGYNKFYYDVSALLCKITKKEDALIFNTGYMANLGVFQALCTRESLVIFDELCHASIIDGIRLSGARFLRYKHNNLEDLEAILEKYKDSQVFIATETVFSITGAVLLQQKIAKIAAKYSAFLITDDAHGMGIIPDNFPEYQLHLKVGVFSKAMGVLGGFVTGDSTIVDYIRNTARSGIYTSALPPFILAGIREALRLLLAHPINKKPVENCQYFLDLFFGKGAMKAESHIFFLECKGNAHAMALSRKLEDYGIFAYPMRPPTVPRAGLRFNFTTIHKKVDIKKLAVMLKEIF